MKTKKETIIRTLVLAFALTNQILESTGHKVIPFTSDQVSELVTILFTVVASAWAWWKNNSFTEHAKTADEVLARLKEDSKK